MNAYNIQRILVPIDLSETSLNALDTAVSIAQKHKASILLLNVIESGFESFSDDTGFFSLANMTNSSDVLTALANGIQHTSEMGPRVLQAEGNVVDTVIKTSLTSQVDLIVMGTHGASGYRDGFVGTNTYNVIKHAHCSVLTVPPGRKYLSFRKPLFPIRPVTGALLRYDILSQFMAPQSSLDVLGLSYRRMERETNVLDKIVEEIRPQLNVGKIKSTTTWGLGENVAEDVLLHAQRIKPDLIAITSVLDVVNKPGFIGPYTQRIINCSKTPLLTIKKVGVHSMI